MASLHWRRSRARAAGGAIVTVWESAPDAAARLYRVLPQYGVGGPVRGLWEVQSWSRSEDRYRTWQANFRSAAAARLWVEQQEARAGGSSRTRARGHAAVPHRHAHGTR